MSKTITFSCTSCNTVLTVPAALAGVSGPCPTCGTTITSPPPEAEPAPAFPRPEHGVNLPYNEESQTIRQYGHPILNGLKGFLAVVALSGATWGVASFLGKGETERADAPAPMPRTRGQIAAPISTPEPLPVEVTVNSSGKIVEGETVFPIVKAATPPAVRSASMDKPLVPSTVINSEKAEMENLLSDPAESIDASDLVAEREMERPTDSTQMVRQCQQVIERFLDAKNIDERMPLLFSERLPAAEMRETLSGTPLSQALKCINTNGQSGIKYLGYVGPNEAGISQHYFQVTLADESGETLGGGSMTLHLSNHFDNFRINADAFVFHANNELKAFMENPQAKPLISYVFLERAPFYTDTTEPQSGTFCVRLLKTPTIMTAYLALVDSIQKPGAILAPIVEWGVAPRAAVVELKHETKTNGETSVRIDRVVKLNWLQSYDTTLPPSSANPSNTATAE